MDTRGRGVGLSVGILFSFLAFSNDTPNEPSCSGALSDNPERYYLENELTEYRARATQSSEDRTSAEVFRQRDLVHRAALAFFHSQVLGEYEDKDVFFPSGIGLEDGRIEFPYHLKLRASSGIAGFARRAYELAGVGVEWDLGEFNQGHTRFDRNNNRIVISDRVFLGLDPIGAEEYRALQAATIHTGWVLGGSLDKRLSAFTDLREPGLRESILEKRHRQGEHGINHDDSFTGGDLFWESVDSSHYHLRLIQRNLEKVGNGIAAQFRSATAESAARRVIAAWGEGTQSRENLDRLIAWGADIQEVLSRGSEFHAVYQTGEETYVRFANFSADSTNAPNPLVAMDFDIQHDDDDEAYVEVRLSTARFKGAAPEIEKKLLPSSMDTDQQVVFVFAGDDIEAWFEWVWENEDVAGVHFGRYFVPRFIAPRVAGTIDYARGLEALMDDCVERAKEILRRIEASEDTAELAEMLALRLRALRNPVVREPISGPFGYSEGF